MPQASKIDRQTAYNRAVLAALREISSAHADTLSSRGTSLGWWSNVAYHHNSRRPAQDAARILAALPID